MHPWNIHKVAWEEPMEICFVPWIVTILALGPWEVHGMGYKVSWNIALCAQDKAH